MAIGQYELWLSHWNGTRLAYLDTYIKFEYTRRMHESGALSLTLPSSFDVSFLQDDYKIEIWRGFPGVAKRLENVYLIRGWRKWTDQDGVDFTRALGVDGNDVLKRRIVWGQPSDSRSRKTGLGGNLIKAYMREALDYAGCYGASVDIRRYYLLRDGLFTVAANANEWTGNTSASFTKHYPGRALFDVANGIVETSNGRGFPIWWHVVPVSRTQYQLRTYKGLFGSDRSASVTITPGVQMGQAAHEYDGVDEFNMVLGQGQKIGLSTYPEYRRCDYSYNNARLYKNPFSWRETFLDCGNATTPEVISMTSEFVAEPDNRPSARFSCKITETDTFRYGRDWDLGDKIRFSYRGYQADIVLTTVFVSVGETEQVYTTFDVDIPLEIRVS